MASFNLTNVFFFCFLIYFKIAHSTAGASEFPVKLARNNGYLKYTFDSGVKCLSIEYDGKQVMKFDPTIQPKSIYFSIRGNTVILNFKDSRDILRLENGEWKTAFSGKFKPTSMNVLFKDGCERYGCLESDKVYTYIPIEDKLFNKVRYHPAKDKEEVLFETDDPLLLINRVVYNERNTESLSVTILHVNGLSRTFVKRQRGKWEESLPSGRGSEMTADKVGFRVQCKLPQGVKFEETKGYLKYMIEDGTKFLSIEYDGKEVMKFDPEKPQPKSLYFSVKGRTAFIVVDGMTNILKLENDEWTSFFNGKAVGKELDINLKESNGFYDYSGANNIHTFTAKDKYLFSGVKKLSGFWGSVTPIWSPALYGDYARKVVYNVNNPKKKVLTLQQINGVTRTFTKPKSGGEWKESSAKDCGTEMTADKVQFIFTVNP